MTDTLERAKSLRIAKRYGKDYKHLASGTTRSALTAEALSKQLKAKEFEDSNDTVGLGVSKQMQEAKMAKAAEIVDLDIFAVASKKMADKRSK